MNRIASTRKIFTGLGFAFCLAIITANASQAETPFNATNDAALGRQVEQLLESRDTSQFAKAVVATAQDWQEAHSTNTVAQLEATATRELQAVAESAKLMLDLAARLNLDPAHVHLHFKAVQAGHGGTMNKGGLKLPWFNQIKIIFTDEPAGNNPETNKKFGGDYELALGGAYQFPGGWRCYQGIRWSAFPEGVADEKTKNDLATLAKIDKHTGSLQISDDPALAALGEALIPFLQQHSLWTFTNAALRSKDEFWQEFQAMAKLHGEVQMPSRKEMDASYDSWMGRTGESAQEVLKELEKLGVDLAGAKIALKNAEAQNPYQRGVFGALEGTDANSIRFTYSVESEHKAKSGASISGDYVLATGRARRGDTRWTVEDKIRWEKFPDGVLGEKALADLKFENYVAANKSLPPGTAAPDIEFVRLDNLAKVKLSDYRGKMVLLDFWATWCGPCQEPMAHLQTLSAQNPDWKDRVQIMSLSIDDTLPVVRDHLDKRGWTNTFNTWAGQGGWLSNPAKQFRVTGVPTMYIINAEGKIVRAGHPAGLERGLTNIVNGLLK